MWGTGLMDRLNTLIPKYSVCVFFSLLVGGFVWASWAHGSSVLLAAEPEILSAENPDGLDSDGGSPPVCPSKANSLANGPGRPSLQGLPFSSMARAVPIVKGFPVERAVINPPIGPPPIASAA
jgi:hypothetical protein